MDQDANTRAKSRQDFSRLVSPRAIAVVGASSDLSQIGGQPLRLLAEYGYRGKVYPVNPKRKEINGLTCYPNIASVPKPCDVALIVLSAQRVPEAVAECGVAGIPHAIVVASGFSEVGGEGGKLQQRLVTAARQHGVRVIGPNCLGVMNLKDGTRIGFGSTMQLKTLIPGPAAMITQSGGFGFGVVATAAYYGIGFNYAVSTGNEADVSMLELVADVLERDDVEVVVALMEGVSDGRRLIEIGARALELGKPIVVWKFGNSDVGRKAAASHTARMTTGYQLFQAAFHHGGFVEVRDIDDLIDVLKVFRQRKLPRNNRVAVVTLSGGAGVLLADCCIEQGLELPQFSEETVKRIREIVVPFASVANPVDATAHGFNENFASFNRVIGEVFADPNIDQIIARAPRGPATTGWARELVELLARNEKPLIVNWAAAPDENAEIPVFLGQHGVPCVTAPGRTARVVALLNEFARKRREFVHQPRQLPPRLIGPQRFDVARRGTLGERRSKEILGMYGIPTVREVLLSPEEVAALERAPLSFPLAVKIDSPDLPHKTEAGAVRLDIRNLDELKSATRDMVHFVSTHSSPVHIDGILLQEMASGVEVMIGALNDRCFGPVVAFGLGGIFAEVLKDVTYRFAPFDTAAAKAMIGEISGHAILGGFRGQPRFDIDALADALSRVSLLIADHCDVIAEIDINPLFVRPAGYGVLAADALVVLKDGEGKEGQVLP